MKLANKYASFFAGLTLAATFVGCGEPAKDEPMKPATDPMKAADTAPPAVTPGIETPKVEMPPTPPPVEAPKVEAAVPTPPPADAPKVEAPKVEAPKA